MYGSRRQESSRAFMAYMLWKGSGLLSLSKVACNGIRQCRRKPCMCTCSNGNMNFLWNCLQSKSSWGRRFGHRHQGTVARVRSVMAPAGRNWSRTRAPKNGFTFGAQGMERGGFRNTQVQMQRRTTRTRSCQLPMRCEVKHLKPLSELDFQRTAGPAQQKKEL